MISKVLQLLLLAPIIVSVPQVLQSLIDEDCKKVKFDVKVTRKPCVGEFSSEVVRHVYDPPKAYARCCISGSPFETFAIDADVRDCRTTSCILATDPNPCDHLSKYFIKRKKVEYKIAAQEPCSVNGGRQDGFVSLCCQPESNEIGLVALNGAEYNEYPFAVRLLGEAGRWECAATIYNQRFLITAAHCVFEDDVLMSNLTAVIGSNIPNIDAPEYLYQVKRAIPHPHYKKCVLAEVWWLKRWDDKVMKNTNDIALLELGRDIKFGDGVKALEIASPNFNPFSYADRVAFSGWGATEGRFSMAYLKKRNLPLREDYECEMVYGKTYQGKKEQFLCLGGVKEYISSALVIPGDSGGAAVCRAQNGRPVLCGVSNFGPSKSLEYMLGFHPPSVFARVSYFHDWIQSVAGLQEKETLYTPILYGKKVAKSKYKHQVQISRGESMDSCGGTLIKPNVVITAAHCIANSGTEDLLGNVKIISGEATFEIKAFKVLPNFRYASHHFTDFSREMNFKNDLAVAVLNSSVDISLDELPRLPKLEETFSKGVELAVSLEEQNKIIVREFTLMSTKQCQERMDKCRIFSYGKVEAEGVLCGVERFSGGSSCERELGGGLICQGNDGRDVLCGVQGHHLCYYALPNKFVDVGKYTSWIVTTIQELRPAEKQHYQAFLENLYDFVYHAYQGQNLLFQFLNTVTIYLIIQRLVV